MRIAILTGGTSSEREIALASAEKVRGYLSDAHGVSVFDFPNDLESFLSRRDEFAVAVPVFHGKGGEDGTVQGFLETLGMPYLFSGVAAHAVASDKDLAKRVAATAGVRTAPWRVVACGEEAADALRDVGFPCVVKPVDGGSTLGVSVARDATELDAALASAFRYAPRALVERYVGGDEFTVAVADVAGRPVAMPVVQIKPGGGLYDYDAKYGSHSAQKLCPAPIADGLAERLRNAALTVHKAIGARHLSRADFIVDAAGEIWFLEINTIPGLSVLFPRAVAASGRDLGGMIARWIDETACSR
jgi:D-alanine-D-alanine ligase